MKYTNIENGKITVDCFDTQTSKDVCKVKDFVKKNLNLNHLEIEDELREFGGKVNGGVLSEIESRILARRKAIEYAPLKGLSRLFFSYSERGKLQSKEFNCHKTESVGYQSKAAEERGDLTTRFTTKVYYNLTQKEVEAVFGKILHSEDNYHITENYVFYYRFEKPYTSRIFISYIEN